MRQTSVSIGVVIGLVSAATAAYSQKPDLNLSTYMYSVLARSGAGSSISALEAANAFEQIPMATPVDLKRAMVPIQSALLDTDPSIRRIGIMAIYFIDQRPDGETFAAPLIPSLMTSLEDPDPQIAELAIRSMTSMQPSAPESVIPPLIAYLGRKEALAGPGATIVFGLARMTTKKNEIATAITTFLRSTDMPPDIRVATLNALGTPSVVSHSLILQIADDASAAKTSTYGFDEATRKEIRLAAINTLQRIGPPAIDLTRPQLSAIANNQNEDRALTSAAKDGLKESNRPTSQ